MARYRRVPERSKIWAEARSSLHPIKLETDGLEGFVDVTIVDGHLDASAPASGSIELDASLLKTGNGLTIVNSNAKSRCENSRASAARSSQ